MTRQEAVQELVAALEDSGEYSMARYVELFTPLGVSAEELNEACKERGTDR